MIQPIFLTSIKTKPTVEDLVIYLIFVTISLCLFILFKNHSFLLNFFKKVRIKPFNKLSINEKEFLTKNSWCNTCGTIEILHCKEEYIKGEYWLVGKCKTCKSTMYKKRN